MKEKNTASAFIIAQTARFPLRLKKRNMQNNKVLIHACCGICSAYPILQLREMGYEPVVYFYNPNIYPETEYQKRLEAEKTLCEYHKCELIIDEYCKINIYRSVFRRLA